MTASGVNRSSGALAPTATNRRRAARLAAVQILYELDITGASTNSVLSEFLKGRWARDTESEEHPLPLGQVDETYLSTLVGGASRRLEDLNDLVAGALSKDWSLNRLEVLVRVVLLCGAFELLACPDVPARVVINEYVTIANAFFTNGEPSLVNAVLDRLARQLRETEMVPERPDSAPPADA